MTKKKSNKGMASNNFIKLSKSTTELTSKLRENESK